MDIRSDIVVTARPPEKHGFFWNLFHKPGETLGRIFSGGSSRGSFDTTGIANAVSMSFRRAGTGVVNAYSFYRGTQDGLYNVGRNVVTGIGHLLTTDPRTTAKNLGYAAAGLVNSALVAEDTPAIQQLSRMGNRLSNASAYDLGYGTGNVIGNVGLLAAPELAFSRTSYVGGLGSAGIRAAEGQATARSFYEAAGWSESRITNHMSGIDFMQPVEVALLPQGEMVVQHVAGGAVGNYFAPIGTPATALGINPSGRVATYFTSGSDVSVLRSTAAPIVDTWTVPGVPFTAAGGGTQYFTANPSMFQRVN